MKNKKGFTLIELLAVIVILAIIALIAVPIILNVINKSRKGAAIDSAYGYVKAIEYQNQMNELDSDKYSKITSGNVSGINVKVKGSKPDSGTVTIDKNQVTEATLCINGYKVEYKNSVAKIADDSSECRNSNETSSNDNPDPTPYNPNVDTGDKGVSVEEIDGHRELCLSLGNRTECFKHDNFEEEEDHLKRTITGGTCESSNYTDPNSGEIINYTNCSNDDFYCSIYSYNYISCTVKSDPYYPTCSLSDEASSCGRTEYDEPEPEPEPITESDIEITHKGIVYLDPTDLSKTCTKQMVDDNHNSSYTKTGVKTGCMKWYIYDDSGSNYKMILDHNTSGNVAWNSTERNGSVMRQVADRLASDTEGWEVTADLISADEVAHIVGADSNNTIKWSSSKQWNNLLDEETDPDTQISSYYLDGSGNTYSGWTSQISDYDTKSKYHWLFLNLNYSNSSGCFEEDSNTYPYGTEDNVNKEHLFGYWTKTPLSSSSVYAWVVKNDGSVDWQLVWEQKNFGVRPVITVSKSQVTVQ